MSDKSYFLREGRGRGHVPYHYRECGLDNIYLLNGFQLDEHDGETYVAIDNVDALWRAIGLNLVTGRKLLTPREIRFLRGQMQMTQTELAHLLRVEDQTVARWEKGQSRLPGPADVAIRVLYLASPGAQPEGRRALARLIPLVEELVGMDEADAANIVFAARDGNWQQQTA